MRRQNQQALVRVPITSTQALRHIPRKHLQPLALHFVAFLLVAAILMDALAATGILEENISNVAGTVPGGGRIHSSTRAFVQIHPDMSRGDGELCPQCGRFIHNCQCSNKAS
ncbi:hypothetical protein PCASD_17495 [Puccinia coronata f. sp. avenae]|uniref:Uncharacterized protein n=1 Tax=Puccinia coronata f. sp. avenae TaxID=200324 RepID=A0A2N5TWC8_9BASI|nr:hypothetical protein PCASD_17495 [Puccinia coronata f. sp. avenae]